MPGTSTEQVVDKGIRQKSIHSFHSLIPWWQCLLSGGTEACSLGLRETPACIHIIQRLSQPRVACWHGSGMTLKKQNACLHAVRHAVEKKLRSEAKRLSYSKMSGINILRGIKTCMNSRNYTRQCFSWIGLSNRHSFPENFVFLLLTNIYILIYAQKMKDFTENKLV